jgi:Holliday junction resolvasome RuvABC endonuclease subunit
VTRCLAFDTAIKTGVCIGDAGSRPRAFTVDLGKAEWDIRFARALRMVERYVTEFQPDLVVVEAPAAGGFQNLDLIGLTVCIRAQAARMGRKVAVYYPNSVRKHFLGKALKARDFPGKTHGAAKRAIKSQVIARCQLLGWDIEDPDAADAAALWDYACALASRSHQITTIAGLFERAP